MDKRFDYFLRNFSLFYDIDINSLSYGGDKAAPISIIQNVDSSFWDEKKDIETANFVWKKLGEKNIPFLFDKNSTKDTITYKNNHATVNYDIVAATFYLLSGWNELVSSGKDELGRIKYKENIISKLNISSIPVVNYYFDVLREAIETVTRKKIKKNLWGENNFGVALTHDIDKCRSAWLEGSFSEFKKKRFASIPKLIFNRIFTKDDWFNFEMISNIEKQYNAKSSFYFLPRKGKSGKWQNADYRVESKSIQKAINYLRTYGNEIGVHGSFGTHINCEKLKKDYDKLGHESIVGNRFHFLMFDPEKSASVLEESNIMYDSSLGFAEHIGFRRGTCYPFYLYNFEKDKISKVIEIPLIVMDGSLADKKYMGLSRQDSLSKVVELINEIKNFGGVFTLLWHNTHFSDYKYTGWKEVYREILDYCKENKGLLTNGGEILAKIKNK
jgi:hypothetical protein